MPNDWNAVRHELDKPSNFQEIANSPWYSDAHYETFSDAEYARRHDLARTLMARDGLDALILTGSQNIYSMGSGVTWGCGLIDARGMCQYLLLPREGDPMLVYPHPGCHIEAVRRMVAIDDVRGGDHGHYGRVLANRLQELSLERGRVGITAADRSGPEYMGVATYQELQACLPDAELVLCPTLFHELTYRKSAEELDVLQRAGALAIAAQEAVQQAAKPGRREYQLAAAATEAILDGGGQVHLMMIGSTSTADPRIVFPNPNPSHRVLREGDMILSEISVAYLGYASKIGHPITIGTPPEAVSDFYAKIVRPGFSEIEATLGPGTDLETISKASGHFRRAGAQSRPIIFHGIDLITAGPTVTTQGVKSEDFDAVLSPGMAVNIEITPINKEGTFGMFLSRSYAITETGIRRLTPYPIDDVLVA